MEGNPIRLLVTGFDNRTAHRAADVESPAVAVEGGGGLARVYSAPTRVHASCSPQLEPSSVRPDPSDVDRPAQKPFFRDIDFRKGTDAALMTTDNVRTAAQCWLRAVSGKTFQPNVLRLALGVLRAPPLSGAPPRWEFAPRTSSPTGYCPTLTDGRFGLPTAARVAMPRALEVPKEGHSEAEPRGI